ncbi:MAG TPA: hypothetical protein PK665_15235, partial [Ignavibacteriaceae bacterium]|nr:hypothetical protein [Ignavibacteriaceae bacterium]
MLKSFNLKLLYLSLLLIINICGISYSQNMTALANDLAEKIIELNIDPNNHLQIIDSLNSNSLFTRILLIQYCGVQEIIESKYNLKLLLLSTPFPDNPPYQYSFTERARILHSLVELKDTTIKEEIKDAIVIMSNDSLNISDISFFARYLMQKFNDDFGWQYIKPYYIRGSSELFGIQVYNLKDFLNSSVRNEVANVLRNLALTDYRADNRITAIEYLTDINDEEVVNIISQSSVNDPDKMNRFLARECLKKINYELYLDLLKSALETETEYRLFIYDELLKSGRPSIYKYVIDLYTSNKYPLDKSFIEDELKNQWLLQPKEEVSVTVLLDSLSSALSQLYSFGWIGNQNFVQELNSYIVNCKNYYQSNDTISSANQMKLLSIEIDKELRDSIDLTNKYVNAFAWNFLYPQTLFIQKKINSSSLVDSLISLIPTSVQAGSDGFTMIIKGTGFNNQSEAYWDGSPLNTFVFSDSILQAYVPPTNVLIENDSIVVNVFSPISEIKNELTFRVISGQQNPNLLVNLKNSLGNQIPASNVMYYEGSWKDAVNNGDGTFTVITSKPTVSIRMFYEYANQTVNNVPAQNNTYTFTTVNAAVQLKNSSGNLMDEGTVQYYAGAWRSFGTTVNGVAYKELLPVNYSFRMTYEGGNQDKQQNLSDNQTVVFQTVNAAVQLKNSSGNLIDEGTVQYYAGAWRSFGTTVNGVAYKELLPVNYSFRMTYEYVSNDKQQNLSENPVVDFNTVLCTIKATNANNQPLEGANTKYYSLAWRDIGL